MKQVKDTFIVTYNTELRIMCKTFAGNYYITDNCIVTPITVEEATELLLN